MTTIAHNLDAGGRPARPPCTDAPPFARRGYPDRQEGSRRGWKGAYW
ncbi:MAG TPA: hypothetical protein VGS06_45905 [Streptosporangiaceae bacterium]|nr:hypothetical protein [Streptosporangiaceae bacterium]